MSETLKIGSSVSVMETRGPMIHQITGIVDNPAAPGGKAYKICCFGAISRDELTPCDAETKWGSLHELVIENGRMLELAAENARLLEQVRRLERERDARRSNK